MAAKTKKAEATKPVAGEKVVKHADLRGKTPDELKDQLVNLKKEQFNLRFQRATQQLEAPARVKLVRREIARVKTILGEKAAAK
jgi:large subunit ribosomal protein L29